MIKRDPEAAKEWQQRSQQRQRESPKPRRPLRKVSQKEAARLKRYKAIRDMFLEQNPYCARCGEAASDVHHSCGRNGARLFDESTFIALCRFCHEWVGAHPGQAKWLGLSQSRHRSCADE